MVKSRKHDLSPLLFYIKFEYFSKDHSKNKKNILKRMVKKNEKF